PQSARFLRRKLFALLESVEQLGQHLRVDAHAGVGDLDANPLRLRVARANVDLPARGGELARVGQQVPEDLLKTRGVAADDVLGGGEVDVHVHALRPAADLEGADHDGVD